jgi:hypothetical protein
MMFWLSTKTWPWKWKPFLISYPIRNNFCPNFSKLKKSPQPKGPGDFLYY